MVRNMIKGVAVVSFASAAFFTGFNSDAFRTKGGIGTIDRLLSSPQVLAARLSAATRPASAKAGTGDIYPIETYHSVLDKILTEYAAAPTDTKGLGGAFRFGVKADGRCAGQSFVESEPELRSEWSSEKGRLPWESVRDAVWAGFDRARDRRG